MVGTPGLCEPKLPFVLRIELIRSKLSIFSDHVSGVDGASPGVAGLDVTARSVA